MAGAAAGGFVTRSLEAMLKECASSKKYLELQKAVRACLDGMKEVKQEQSFDKSTHAATLEAEKRADGDEAGKEANAPVAKGEAAAVNQSVKIHEPIITTLAHAGRTLEEEQAELLLQPLRLAFETKNIKLVEFALDCLHKLIAYNHLEGDLGLEGGKNSSLFTGILNKVFDCVDNSLSDSTILQVLKVLLTAVSSTNFRVHGEPLLGVIKVCYNIALHSKSPISEATSKAMLTQMISIVCRRMESDQVAKSSSSFLHSDAPSGSTANAENIEISLDDEVEKKFTLGDVLSISPGDETSPTSVEEIQHLAGSGDIKGLEAILDKVIHFEQGKKISRGIDLENMNVGERDALLLFRTLCKMATSEEIDELTTKTRLLSLELLQALLEGVSQSFTKHLYFIDSVKAYLSYALLRASVSSSPLLFQYATGIFAVLLLRFRKSLKGEIGVFFPLIILRSLDNLESPLSQRTSVLRMLEKVCKDSQMLADIYVNYDCDLAAPNLFERMVNCLSRLAQATTAKDPNPSEQSQCSNKASSLQCLVSVLKSLVDWEKQGRESEKQRSILQSLEKEVLATEGIIIDEAKNQEDSLNQFEKAKAHKSTLEAAIFEFNHKPSKGIEYLLSNNLVEYTASSVAQFLKNTPSLDKAMIGEYLGLHEEFPHAVMHAYFDSMKFSGLKFDTAIREFFVVFRLPGEAQKIDRIMEKFAERYCADNPGLFKNADTAYVLAYAVIMLNTDAHNPMVWPKMSKSDFVRINSISDTGERAPLELLEEIYDSVVKEEIKMQDELTARAKSSRKRSELEDFRRLVNILNLAIPKRKSGTGIDTKTEGEDIKKQMQDLLQNQGAKGGVFYTAQKVEIVRPMVEAVGWPLLATFSVTMEEGENKPSFLLCMEGFRAGIHITCVLGMDTMRFAFLTSLVRFTFLHSPKAMRSKNVEALRTLLSLCDLETNALQDTWNAVLECVSRLEYITSTPSIAATVMQGSNQISRDSVLQSLKELAGKPAEQVFVNTIKLPSDAIIEFFNSLCGISAEELKQTPARVFSLQKLVEISYYNMARIHLVWARIWSVLAQHFITAGSHYEEKIAMCAIDSLRQLGMKYLERTELKNFTFQNDILKPFVILMRNSTSQKIRSLIVDSIVQIIKSKVGIIRSGWRSVFTIFTASTDDDLESVVDSAFENVEQVILENFDQIVGSCFMDCVNCLIGFANNKKSPRTSLKAIALLRLCEARLAEGFIPGADLKAVSTGEEAHVEVTEHYWFPMLAGLSDLTLDSRSEVRNCALEVLFDLLNERGRKFSSSFWKIIFNRVLFPIFDHVRYSGKDGLDSSGDEWLRDTSIHSLQLLCDLFNKFYKEVSFMLPPLLSLLLDCAKKTDQTVVSISLGALVHLIEVGGHQFSCSDWDTLIKSIREVSYTTQPLELLNSFGLENSKIQMLVPDDVDADIVNNLSKDSHRNSKEGGRAFDQTSNRAYRKEEDLPSNVDEFEGLPSPSGTTEKLSDVANIQRSQTFGRRIMGNMMDNLLLRRSLTSKQKNQIDFLPPSSPDPDTTEPILEDMVGNPTMEKVRGKCITQLLLLGAIDSIQKRHWIKLEAPQKIAIIDILASFIEFAASYNSSSNLRMRMHQIPSERPPLNLLHQELKGTSIYLDILHKSTALHGDNEVSEAEEKLTNFAEEKLVSFCGQILREVSDLQLITGDAANGDIHRVLDLRAPIIVKVLQTMCSMNSQIFKRHVQELYPLIAKLICCDQMNVRGALADLISTQLTSLLPSSSY